MKLVNIVGVQSQFIKLAPASRAIDQRNETINDPAPISGALLR